jgi:hypothetical protein
MITGMIQATRLKPVLVGDTNAPASDELDEFRRRAREETSL